MATLRTAPSDGSPNELQNSGSGGLLNGAAAGEGEVRSEGTKLESNFRSLPNFGSFGAYLGIWSVHSQEVKQDHQSESSLAVAVIHVVAEVQVDEYVRHGQVGNQRRRRQAGHHAQAEPERTIKARPVPHSSPASQDQRQRKRQRGETGQERRGLIKEQPAEVPPDQPPPLPNRGQGRALLDHNNRT